MVIKDLTTLKKFFQEKVNFPIFGTGVYAFHRLGPDDFLPDYRILALRRSLEGEKTYFRTQKCYYCSKIKKNQKILGKI